MRTVLALLLLVTTQAAPGVRVRAESAGAG